MTRSDRWSIGLRPLAADGWLASGGDTDRQRAEKAVLLRSSHAACVATTGEARVEDACSEAAELVFDAVGSPRSKASGIVALEAAAASISEDLVLMMPAPRPDDAEASDYVLGAGVVCFPTRWLLADKIGRPMSMIHAPVPGYEAQIGRATNRVFASLDGRIVLRTNWSLLDSGELHQPRAGHSIVGQPALSVATAGSHVWVRTERQTLRRLSGSNAVLFTIRVFQCRLDELQSELLRSLLTALENVHHDMRAYKGLDALDQPVRAWLKRALAE